MDATQATVLAAVATSVSAVVIAWQAWEIRRTAAATEKTLRVSRESLSTSKALAVEALRTRLDARGQAVRIHVAQPEWPPLQPSDFGDPQPLPYGTTYRMSRDRDVQLMLRAGLVIVNEGDRDAILNLHPPLRPAGELGPFPRMGTKGWCDAAVASKRASKKRGPSPSGCRTGMTLRQGSHPAPASSLRSSAQTDSTKESSTVGASN